MAPRTHALPVFAATLFLVSGATALVYQLIWFKRLAHAFGSSSLAMTAVLAGFLLGLGLGALAFGPLADRLRRPLAGYGLLEAGIALYALAFGPILGLAEGGLRLLYPILEGLPLAQALVRLLAAFAVLALPCALMGATLPMLVRALAGPLRGLGLSTSWMYAANTGGAALGCYLAGFHLLPALGLVNTLHLAVAVNLLLAALALAVGMRAFERDPLPGRAADLAPPPAGASVPARPLGLAALASGAAALILQLAWARQLSLVLGGTTYAFSAMLFVVLLGIGLGSLAAPSFLARRRDPLPVAVAIGLGVVATTLVGQACLPALTEWVGALRNLRGTHLGNAAVCVGASAILQFLPSFGAGLLFPLLVDATGAGPGGAGRAVGRIYAWNTLGTTLGAVLAHLALVPQLGTDGAVLVALALYLILVALLAQGRAARPRWRVRIGMAAAFAAAVWLAPRHDPLRIERGLYLYGYENRHVFVGVDLLYHRAGASANVLVTGHGSERSLRVNGKVDASTLEIDQRTQLGTAYLPRFLHPSAQTVLVIGQGSGATAGASLLFPDTHVTVIEIEPAVVEASRLFESINHSPERSPAFRILVEDGRTHIAGTRERYDLILTEPSNPWIAGIANLFTREFYVLARRCLEPGGILGQWIQTYSLSEEEYVSVVLAILDVFENVALLRLSSGDTMLIASDRPLVPDAATLDRAQALVQAQPRVRADLMTTFRTDDVRSLIARHLLLDDSSVRALVGAAPQALMLTDGNLRLEYTAPQRLYHEPPSELGASLGARLLGYMDPLAYAHLLRAIEAGPLQADAVVETASILRFQRHDRLARALLELALDLDPRNAYALAGLLALAPEDSFDERLELLSESNPTLAHETALELARGERYGNALAIVERLQVGAPTSGTLERTRANLLERLGRREEAAAARALARELDPLLGVPEPE